MQPERQPEKEPERRFREVPKEGAAGEPVESRAGYEPGARYAPARGLRAVSLVRWAPVVGGTLTGLATLVLLNLLGGAFGITSVTNPAAYTGPFVLNSGPAIWTFVVFLVALFVGGWVTARAMAFGNVRASLLNAGVMWALFVTIGVFLAALGAQVLLGRILGGFVFFRVGGPILTQSPAIWMFVALIVGLAAAMFGGLVGRGHRMLEEEERRY